MKFKTHYIHYMNTKNIDIEKELKQTFYLITKPIIECQEKDINLVKIKLNIEYEFIDYDQTKFNKKRKKI